MELNLKDRFQTFANGKMVLDIFDEIFLNLEDLAFFNDKAAQQLIQPITLVFLDINMPVVDGLETAKQIKQKIDIYNKKVSEVDGSSKLLRPLLIHLTQYDNSFKSFIKKDEEADLYFQKPISRRDLATLLKILKFI